MVHPGFKDPGTTPVLHGNNSAAFPAVQDGSDTIRILPTTLSSNHWRHIDCPPLPHTCTRSVPPTERHDRSATYQRHRNFDHKRHLLMTQTPQKEQCHEPMSLTPQPSALHSKNNFIVRRHNLGSKRSTAPWTLYQTISATFRTSVKLTLDLSSVISHPPLVLSFLLSFNFYSSFSLLSPLTGLSLKHSGLMCSHNIFICSNYAAQVTKGTITTFVLPQ